MSKLFTKAEAKFVAVLGEIIDCNPFLPKRMKLERAALGSAFVETDANWNLDPTIYRRSINVTLICDKAEKLLASKREHRQSAGDWSREDMNGYADLFDYVMFSRLAFQCAESAGCSWDLAARNYPEHREEFQRLHPEPLQQLGNRSFEHLFAMYFQIYRAFRIVFDHLHGNSTPVIKLRGEVFESIFTYDVRRYREYLYTNMCDFSTLITGPSGSGKELVARAIGLSSYVPFDPQSKKFIHDEATLFYPINLSALSPTLIESELFGHAKGAFTGAVAKRKGWLESCPDFGAVFLDEIGELDESIQVKLLRVLQERSFQRLGETEEVPFRGKIIAATNRELERELQEGTFRSDFYYRICSDQICMPSLQQRCQANSEELPHLVGHLLRRIVPQQHDRLGAITDEIVTWIHQNLGKNYEWPGNVRELDQCIRSWLIRQNYRACQPASAQSPDSVLSALSRLDCTADELVAHYCRAKYEELQSYQAVGELLGLDRRTVKSRIDSL